MSNTGFNQFKGDVNTERIKYIADPQLRNIVNVSIALARPLIVKGEPGTGKTLLSHAIAESLGKRLIVWNVKSNELDITRESNIVKSDRMHGQEQV